MLEKSIKKIYECKSSGEALFVFANEHEKFLNSPYSCHPTQKLIHPEIGSAKFRKLQLEWLGSEETIDENVCQMVKHIWQEVSGTLESYFTQPIESIQMEKVGLRNIFFF